MLDSTQGHTINTVSFCFYTAHVSDSLLGFFETIGNWKDIRVGFKSFIKSNLQVYS